MNVENIVNTFFTSIGALVTFWALTQYVMREFDKAMKDLNR